jgi:hypothetical protein
MISHTRLELIGKKSISLHTSYLYGTICMPYISHLFLNLPFHHVIAISLLSGNSAFPLCQWFIIALYPLIHRHASNLQTSTMYVPFSGIKDVRGGCSKLHTSVCILQTGLGSRLGMLGAKLELCGCARCSGSLRKMHSAVLTDGRRCGGGVVRGGGGGG